MYDKKLALKFGQEILNLYGKQEAISVVVLDANTPVDIALCMLGMEKESDIEISNRQWGNYIKNVARELSTRWNETYYEFLNWLESIGFSTSQIEDMEESNCLPVISGKLAM